MTEGNRVLRAVGLVGLVASLVACSGGPGPETVFVEDRSWQGAPPEDAMWLPPDEFRALVLAGEVTVGRVDDEAERAAADADRFAADLEVLSGLTDPSPYVQALLDDVARSADPFAEPVAIVGDASFVLLSLAAQARHAVEVLERAADPANAHGDYRLTYDLMPHDLRVGAPTPESLAGSSLETLRAALDDLEVRLAGFDAIDPTRVEAVAVGPGGIAVATVVPGDGTDRADPCRAPTNHVARLWFPLKSFLSPVKHQGNRGTCWAFTAVGAIESRERVQNDRALDLSEQFLVNKVREHWYPRDDVEEFNAERAVNAAADRGTIFAPEAGWTYNAATQRYAFGSPKGSFVRVCDGYSGTCSRTAHQSARVCSTFVFTVCGYRRVSYSGPGVGSSRALQVWSSGQRLDLARVRLLLAQGHVLMASFPVHNGFTDVATTGAAAGVITDYARNTRDAEGAVVAGSSGGHAVQIVAFLSNAQLSTPGNPVQVAGGGYFVVKNSWGCDAADGGYYYVPADYLIGHFTSLSVLDFGPARSQAWTREQAAPGGTQAPAITVVPAPSADLRVQRDLAQLFHVAHPVAKAVHLTVTASGYGTVYQGTWSTDPTALFGPTLPFTFTRAGATSVTLVARYGTTETRRTFSVDVVNTAPRISVFDAGAPRVGEAYPMGALIVDPNEADAALLCANTTWAVDAPDTLSATTGCSVTVTFGEEGVREVRIATRDSDGLTAASVQTRDVLPPPENPFPRLLDYGVYALNSTFSGGIFIGCSHVKVASGATIDLRNTGCTLAGTPPRRYSGRIAVENPSGETLTYDWRLWITVGTTSSELQTAIASSQPSFVLTSPGNSVTVTRDCRVTVRVNAPEPERSKPATVWTGRCTYDAQTLN